ncbi:MAG: AsmA family protein [Planctomycetota bacterium]
MRRIILVIVLMLAGSVAGVAWWLGRSQASLARGLIGKGTSLVEQWCSQQVQSIANDLIRPTLRFDSMDFQLPATATFNHVTLRDGEDTVVEADALRIEFAEVPRAGKPVIIKAVNLDRPIVRLLIGADGQLAGFHDFIRSTEGQAHEDGGSTRPSDVFAIRVLGIESGTLIYREMDGDTMQLDDITMQFNSDPRGDDPSVYVLDGHVKRPPVIEVDLDATFDIDTADVQFNNSRLGITLGPDQYGSLPPQIQQFVRERELSGDFVLTLAGLLPLGNMAKMALGLEVNLTDGHVVFEKYELPIKSLNIQGRQTVRRLDLSPITLEIYDGSVNGGVDFQFSEVTTIDIDVHGKDMQLEQALRTPPGEEARYSGIVSLDGEAMIHTGESVEGLEGSGSIVIRKGQLLNDPVFGGMVGLLGLSDEKTAGGQDNAAAKFQLFDDHVHFDEFELVSGTIACAGRGDLYFDSRLDLVFSGGYLRRQQIRLGEIGKLLAGVTDQLVSYRVGGTTDKPTFNVQPFGLGGGGGK